MTEVYDPDGNQSHQRRDVVQKKIVHLNPLTSLVGLARHAADYAPPPPPLQWDGVHIFEVLDCQFSRKLNERNELHVVSSASRFKHGCSGSETLEFQR